MGEPCLHPHPSPTTKQAGCLIGRGQACPGSLRKKKHNKEDRSGWLGVGGDRRGFCRLGFVTAQAGTPLVPRSQLGARWTRCHHQWGKGTLWGCS